MKFRVAKKVIYGRARDVLGPAQRLGTIEAARTRLRRYVGALPPAWDGIEVATDRARRFTYLVRHRYMDFVDAHRRVMKATGYPFGRDDKASA